VFGGKIDEFLVKFLGVFAGEFCKPADGVRMNVHQTPCFPHSVALGDMRDDGDGFFFRQSGIEKNGSATLGKSFFAHEAVQQSRGVRAVNGADADIIFAAHGVFFTIYILTTKVFEIVHDRFLCSKSFADKQLEGKNRS
jgi:hypothetical protein